MRFRRQAAQRGCSPVTGFRQVETARGTFAVRLAGAQGPTVLLVHGFPDDASTWDGLAAALNDAGYRTAAVNLRGYAPSPLEGSLAYDDLVEDLLHVVDTVSPAEPVGLVAHDYGAQLAYTALAQSPHRFAGAVLLSGAHPAFVQRNARRSVRQLWFSRYIVLFQLGTLADRVVARDNFAYVRRLWRRWSPGFVMPDHHVRHVVSTLASSMPAPVAMYRAGGFSVAAEPIDVPTLYITGSRDGCALPFLADGQEALFTRSYVAQTWEQTGHFPHFEQPQRTSAAAIDWLTRYLPSNASHTPGDPSSSTMDDEAPSPERTT